MVEVAVVPIGGGGLISGVATALKSCNPAVRIVGVESSGAPAMTRSVAEGRLVTLDKVDCIIDGLRVKRVGEKTFESSARMWTIWSPCRMNRFSKPSRGSCRMRRWSPRARPPHRSQHSCTA